MKCPHCGGSRTSRYKAPIRVGFSLQRRHRCLECRKLFVSIQTVPAKGQESMLEALSIVEQAQRRSLNPEVLA